ncbi:MAG: lytic transglycosylase, partial [Gammaproteobacteria bacterium HGW-Gammaproteobacteria-14]
GPWQFIPSTGKAFGMEQHYWYDGRRDILQSTEAALTYLDRLAKRFGDDWELALASYNAGGGTVSRAITRNRNRNRPVDYWNLDLPRETRDYVPKLIALSQIVRDPQKYGLTLTPIANAPYFEVVDIEGQLDLKLAAEMAQTDVNEIYYLNAGFSQWATPPNGPHRILVPVSQANIFRQALAELPPEQRLRWQEYTIRPGDTLGGIARQHNTNIEALREANRLRGNTIVAGRTLLIPQPSAAADSYPLSADNRLQTRQNQSPAGRSRTNYTVRSGDSLWTIARRHNVTVRELAHWNGMAPGDTLAAGRQLVIWTQGPTAAPSADRPEMIRRVNYAVRRGDSLHAIANRFNVSVTEITSWNNLNARRYLQPGQRLTLFVDVRNAP